MLHRTLSRKVVPLIDPPHRIPHCVLFDVRLEEIGPVPEDWTEIQVYVKAQDRVVAEVLFECSKGRVILPNSVHEHRMTFHLWLESLSSEAERLLPSILEIGVRFWSIETMAVVCRSAYKTAIDASLYASHEQKRQKILLPLDPVADGRVRVALLIEATLTTSRVDRTSPLLKKQPAMPLGCYCERSLSAPVNLTSPSPRTSEPQTHRIPPPGPGKSDSSSEEDQSIGLPLTPSTSLPAFFLTETEPVVGLIEGAEQMPPTDIAVAECSTRLICTDDLDESELGLNGRSSCARPVREEEDFATEEEVAFAWLADEDRQPKEGPPPDLLTMRDLAEIQPPLASVGQTVCQTRPRSQRHSKRAVSTQTDLGLKSLEVSKWKRNPSFHGQEMTQMVEPVIRTADQHLIEVGRQAIAQGLLQEASKSHKVQSPRAGTPLEDSLSLQDDPILRVTGEDGMTWDHNPAFTEEGSPKTPECSIRFFAETPTPEDFMLRNAVYEPLSRQRSSCSGYQSCSPSARWPWMQQEGLYEWMDVMQLRDVGVQTAFLDEEHEEHYEMIFSPSSAEAVPRKSSLELRETTSVRDSSSPWLKADTSYLSNWSPEEDLAVPEPLDPPRPKRSQLGCSTSIESDAFNNLPLAQITEHPPPLIERIPPEKSEPCQEFSQSSRTEAMRLDLLECEIRVLKKQVMKLEVELCNKDGVIAQQDAVIHRFTTSLRSQRHRRNASATAGSSPAFDLRDVASDLSRTSIRSIAEEPVREVHEIVQAQQEQLRKLMEEIGKCRLTCLSPE